MGAWRRISAVVVIGLGGCRSSPDLARLGARPADFAMSVTVFGSGRSAPGAGSAPRPGRYLVEADGLLRAAPGAAGSAFPPPLRQLAPSEVDRLWSLVRESGLLEARSRFRVASLADAAGPDTGDEPMAAFHVEYGGAHTYSRVPLDRGSDEAVLAERLIDRLAGLARLIE